MINSTNIVWHEFMLRTLTLHWLTAMLVVLFVALMIAGLKSLNATTRHNIWLLTLISLALMPLLIFAPRPELPLPQFNWSVTAGMTSTSTIDHSAAERLEAQRSAKDLAGAQNDSSLASSRPENSLAPDRASGYESMTPGADQLAAPLNGQATSANTGVSVTSVIIGVFVFWLVGVLFLLRRLWGEYRAARELELQSDSVTPYFERRFDQLCARLGIDERPLLRFHAGINAPMTVGLVRVWVAIPMTWRETVDDSVFDQTLTHELGHIVRRDPAIHTIQRVLGIILWMYPAVWYVTRQLEVERESACDDWVLMHDGKSNTYASNLLDVAESLYLQPQVLAVGCLRSHSQLSRRIQNLLNKSSDHKVHNSWKLLSLTMVGLLGTLGVSAMVWPDARQLAPPAAVAAQEPVATRVADIPLSAEVIDTSQLPVEPPPAPIGPSSTSASAHSRSDQSKDISRFESKTNPQSAPDSIPAAAPAPVATPKPAPVPAAKRNAPTQLVTENGRGSLTIERQRNGKVSVDVFPEITQSDALLYAAWTGDATAIKKLNSEGGDINQVYARATPPNTALEAAILKGHKKAVKTLLYLGVDVSSGKIKSDTERLNPLTAAASAGRYEIAELLLSHGVKPEGRTLVAASQQRDVRLVELLLNRDNCDCLDVEEALLVAISNQDTRMVDVLIKYDVDIDDSAVLLAIQTNNTKLVRKLLSNFDGSIDDSTLTLAVENRNSSIVDSLLAAGAEPDEGVVTMAVQQGDTLLVNTLLKHDIDIEEGALVLAIQQRDTRMVDALMRAGADIGDGALAMAVQTSDARLVKSLLKHEPDIDEGALVLAIQLQDIEMVELLLDAGADIEDGALIIAKQTRNKKLIELIRARSGRTYEELRGKLYDTFDQIGERKANYQANANSTARSYQYSSASNQNKNDLKNHNKNVNKNESSNTGGFVIDQWPVRSNRISLGFADVSPKYGSHKEPHEALDFPIQAGSPVYAVAAGYVKESRFSKGYGHYIVIDHGNGYKTKYANNEFNKVERGDYVNARQQIAIVGSTAKDSTGPHLHFEVWFSGKKLDPESLFARK